MRLPARSTRARRAGLRRRPGRAGRAVLGASTGCRRRRRGRARRRTRPRRAASRRTRRCCGAPGTPCAGCGRGSPSAPPRRDETLFVLEPDVMEPEEARAIGDWVRSGGPARGRRARGRGSSGMLDEPAGLGAERSGAPAPAHARRRGARGRSRSTAAAGEELGGALPRLGPATSPVLVSARGRRGARGAAGRRLAAAEPRARAGRQRGAGHRPGGWRAASGRVPGDRARLRRLRAASAACRPTSAGR